MKTKIFIAFVISLVSGMLVPGFAQNFNQLTDSGQFTSGNSATKRDSLSSGNKEIPKGLKVWTVDERFGERIAAEPDTMPHMFMNTIFDGGLRGEYTTLGNVGSPRINRIFIDRSEADQFVFTQPYDYFITPVSQFHFTNTLSPITNISYNECGNRENGENHFRALFGVNAGKKIGVGFKFGYISRIKALRISIIQSTGLISATGIMPICCFRPIMRRWPRTAVSRTTDT